MASGSMLLYGFRAFALSPGIVGFFLRRPSFEGERVSEFEFMALEEKGHCAINKVVIKWQ